jgi:aromatic-L-amino-acid decarboxylase
MAPVPLQTVCVRHEPPGPDGKPLEGEALDRHTLGWAEKLNRSGFTYLTPAVVDGRWLVRVSIGALRTEQEDVAALWEEMKRAVA